MRIPAATYRLQLRPSFGFREASRALAYLKDLGVTDVYASPVFAAREGSTHGYDVTDPASLNPELGTEEDFDRLVERRTALGMGWVQDIVPNHAAFDSRNGMLADVLENGECSGFRGFFDITWDHPYETLRGRLLAPFLPALYGESLENGEMRLEYDDGALVIAVFDLRLPLRAESYLTVLSAGLSSLKKRLGEGHPGLIKLDGVIFALKNLPGPGGSEQDRTGQVRFIKGMIRELHGEWDEVREFIDGNIKMFNGEAGGADKYALLDRLLGEQLFRLSFWKVATEEINYRRFFSINGLITLRAEDPRVFDHTHSLIKRLAASGAFTGLRVDHIDGLFDPAGYLERLREETGGVYTVVEKILAPNETLPEDWPVEGTTGYDFLNAVNGLFCDTRNRRAFTTIYSKFTGRAVDYDRLLSDKKRLIIEKHMTGDVDNLARVFRRIIARDRYGSDITHYGLKKAVVEILASFPVYRTYAAAGGGDGSEGVRAAERNYILEAVDSARRANPDFVYEINFTGRLLLLEFREHITGEERREWLDAVMRFQQFTGPLMAKGFEDTTLYVYNRLISLNEVGGSPERFGVTAKKFHDFNSRRALEWPATMNATSTHDSKRGEDVRARINVLSEMPVEWEASVREWSQLNRRHRKTVEGRLAPDKNDEYFLYQTLVGAMPFVGGWGEFVGRVKDYVIKAVREAKVHTAWLKPDTNYEGAFLSFIDEVTAETADNRFLPSFRAFQEKVARCGIVNSLAQTLLKIASPGVPDFYQGAELWDLNLVDPDNRRPVDFEIRSEMLKGLKEGERNGAGKFMESLLADPYDGRVKLFLIWKALASRLSERKLFEGGDYIPVHVEGEKGGHVVAFARKLAGGKGGERWALAVVPRFVSAIVSQGGYPIGEGAWGDTSLSLPAGAPSRWRSALTGGPHRWAGAAPVADALGFFPVGLFTARGGD